MHFVISNKSRILWQSCYVNSITSQGSADFHKVTLPCMSPSDMQALHFVTTGIFDTESTWQTSLKLGT